MWIEHVIINDFVKQHHVFLVAMLTGCLATFFFSGDLRVDRGVYIPKAAAMLPLFRLA